MAGARKKGNNRHPAGPKAKFTPTQPPLSTAAATDYYLMEEELGVYREFWENLGYYLDKGAAFPPFNDPSHARRTNNRASGWNGLFHFSLMWREAANSSIRNQVMATLHNTYVAALDESFRLDEAPSVIVRLSGKQVKSLTRFLNRQYQNGYLVWRED